MARANQPLLFVELNEVNFEYVEYYVSRGKLPAFAAFFDAHGYSRTTSEHRYEELEPWIQWVTAHTGLTLAEHNVFRLGDIVNHDIPQIWERLEAKGFSVGAISPMNAKFRLNKPAFFVPDPWTSTETHVPAIYRRLYRAIKQAVNDNANGKLTVQSALDLIVGWVGAARPRNYIKYVDYAWRSRRSPWVRAMFLDLLLGDVFFDRIRKTRPDFATLFVNAAAHIQHHYMFSAQAYIGNIRNPEWYVGSGTDPILDVYMLYDDLIAEIQRQFPEYRLMLGTGLHQDPNDEISFYWRLKDHGRFLQKIGVEFSRVEPRMSRDFIIYCASEDQAKAAAARLERVRADDDTQLFEVDNRGKDLFVMLTYSKDISAEQSFNVGEAHFNRLRDEVAFVAIKNGKHNGIGYFADSGMRAEETCIFELRTIPSLVEAALAA